MNTKEMINKKYCCFYASDFNLEMILLPYIKNNIDHKFVIFTEENLEDSMKILLNRINLKMEEKNKVIKLNWNIKKVEDYSSYNFENHTIIICGMNKFVHKVNNELEKFDLNKCNIIDCYNINDKNIEFKEIQAKYDEILNTKSYKKI